jgi:hypothetical protein
MAVIIALPTYLIGLGFGFSFFRRALRVSPIVLAVAYFPLMMLAMYVLTLGIASVLHVQLE